MNSCQDERRTRLAIAAVPYSSNLGDGVIHEVMCRLLLETGEFSSVSSLDIAGRTRYAGLDSTERIKRRRALGVINLLPQFLRPVIVLIYNTTQYLRQYRHLYKKTLQNADHLVIGGGHLFSDLDLNFPTKLFCLYRDIRRLKVPFSIYGVGATDNWSPLARYFFKQILGSPLLRAVSVRDEHSQSVLERALRTAGSSLKVNMVWDPAVATASIFPDSRRESAQFEPVHLGLNVADVALLAKAGDRNTGITDGLLFFSDLLRLLQATPCRITLFTNGAEEDEIFLDLLLGTNTTGLFRARRPLTPADLISLIQTFDLVISHRLHANIISFSYGIPGIGLGWDKKLHSFFKMTNRSRYLIEADDGNSTDIACQVQELVLATAWKELQDNGVACTEARQQLLDFAKQVIHASPHLQAQLHLPKAT